MSDPHRPGRCGSDGGANRKDVVSEFALKKAKQALPLHFK